MCLMTYDPQAKGQRPRPKPEAPAPIDALLPDDPMPDDPMSVPAVTPEPADPPPDKLLINGTLLGALGVLVAALLLRYLCKRCCNARRWLS